MTAWHQHLQRDPSKGINVDLFAGGGGTSTGIEIGTGRYVDIAINHDPDAVSMHIMNHPHTKHYICDVYEVDPIEACGDAFIQHLHASPDCTDHTQAKGGQARKKSTRSLSWVVHKWTGKKRPRTITLENVWQIVNWSPLVAKRCKTTGRVIKLDGTVAEKGERVPVNEQFLIPNPKKKGRNWKHFIEGLRGMGYAVQWKVLPADHYGAGTSRERLYLIARCDGRPILWPKQTHFKNPAPGQKRWVTTGDHIDWSIASQSIFNRKRPLAEATMTRIAKGIRKYVLDSKTPFFAPAGAVAFITEHANGSSQRNFDANEPLRTICAGVKGGHFALVTAFLARHFGTSIGQSLERPCPTILTNDKSSLVTAVLSKEDEAGALRCAAFLLQYYSTGGQWGDLNKPLNSITTRDRMALVTVWIQGEAWVIVDIHMRMLSPRELYLMQGFPPEYIIDRGHDGRIFTKEKQVRFVGNSVSPLPMAAICRTLDIEFYDAVKPGEILMRKAV